MTQETQTATQEASPLQAYNDAKHDIRVGMGAMIVGETILGAAYAYINYMETGAEHKAQAVLRKFDEDMSAGVRYPLNNTTVVTTQAARYGLTYQADLEKDMSPEVRTVAAHVLDAVQANDDLGKLFENFVESELILRMEDEMGETAQDLAVKSPIVKLGLEIHESLEKGLPIPVDLFERFSTLLGHVSHTAMTATGLAILEPGIKQVSTALKESPKALQYVIAQELGQVIAFDSSRNLRFIELDAQLHAIVASLNNDEVSNIIASKEFNWSQLGTVLAAEFAIQHGQEMFERDEEGLAHTPDNLQRIALAVQMIGSLDKHQNEHSLQTS